MIYELLAMAFVATALLILWKVSFFIFEERNIKKFFPFFMLGIIFLIYPIFIIFGFFLKWPWFFLEFSVFLILLFIFIKLKGAKNGCS
jgi:hypothetical protein